MDDLMLVDHVLTWLMAETKRAPYTFKAENSGGFLVYTQSIEVLFFFDPPHLPDTIPCPTHCDHPAIRLKAKVRVWGEGVP